MKIKHSKLLFILFTSGFERLIFNEIVSFFSASSKLISISPVPNPMIPVSTSCYTLPKKFLHILIMKQNSSASLDTFKSFDEVWYEGLFWLCLMVSVHDGAPQGSIIDSLLFLIYINELSDNLLSNLKIFAHNISLFSVFHDVNTSAKELNEDLKKVND